MHAQGVVRAVLVCGALPAFQLPGERALKRACSLLKVNLARRLIHVLKEHFTRSKSIKSCCRSLLLVRCKSQAPPPPLPRRRHCFENEIDYKALVDR